MTMTSDYRDDWESTARPLFDSHPESASEEAVRTAPSPPGGAAPQGIPSGSGWPDLPAPIMAEPAPQAPYPEDCLPADLEEALRAAQRLAQCPAATAGAALLGALALLAQDDYRVETLAPDPSPPSLYLVAMSESGSHKTTAFKLLGQGHQEADALLKARWDAAQEQYRRRHEGDDSRAGGPEPGPRPQRPSTPVSLLQDFTTDGLLQHLQGGRPSIAMWTAEAGVQINHSFSRSQAARTVSYLNSGWESGQLSKIRARDGSQVYITGDTYSMSMVWAGQPDILTPVLFGAMALNGWLARCLISRDDAYPDRDPGRPRAHDRDRVQTFNRIVVRHRERQDREMEFASRPGEPPRERTLIALSEGARGLLDEFYVRQRSLAARLRDEGRRHENTWAGRAPEQSARVAALFTSWEAYRTGWSVHETLYTGEDTMSRAIRLVEWHQGEVARLAGESGATDNARHASHLAQVIARVVAGPASTEGTHPLLTGRGLAVNTVANRLGHPEIRGNPDLRRTVIGILVEYGYIRPAGARGRYEVHPRIGDVV